MSDQKPEAPRDNTPVVPATVEAPARRPMPLIPSLQVMDLGAVGMTCDIDDPDCVLPGASSMTGDEGDA